MRALPRLPTPVQVKPQGHPPCGRHESTHESLSMPDVVVGLEQLTAGGGGIENASKSMCCASLHRLTTAPF